MARRASGGFRLGLGAGAFIGGLVIGTVLWSRQIHRSRRDLFTGSPLRRLAALGYLGGRPGAETALLLSEYVAWESHPLLRRRGRVLLDRMSPHLD